MGLSTMSTFRNVATATMFVWVVTASIANGQCCGDCNGDGEVTVDEVVRSVDYASHKRADCDAATMQVARKAFQDSPAVQQCIEARIAGADLTAGPVVATGTIATSCGVVGCYSSVLVYSTFSTPLGTTNGYSINVAAVVTVLDGGSTAQVRLVALDQEAAAISECVSP